MLLGIDTTNWIHSLWHAQRGTGVLASVRARISALCDRFAPQHVVACFDRRSFRSDLYLPYKANRKAKDERLQRDLDEGPEAVQDLATIAAEDGFEADDGLATLAAAGGRLGQQVVICSPDKDLNQVLRAGECSILRSFRLSAAELIDFDWMTADRLQAETQLVPAQWPDYQALCGDSTDGVPGCAGIGEKTSLAIMHAAGSLAQALADPWSLPISAKQRGAFTAFRAQADLMLRLVTLRTDCAAVWDALR